MLSSFNRRVIIIRKKEIIKEIVECAKIYNDNLNNKNLLFIYKENEKLNYIETKFLKSNFFHLTGLESKNINPNYFYEKCLNNKISENDIELKKNGTTILKLSVLRNLMYINKNAKLIGNFNRNGILLSTEKLIGNTSACLGLRKINKYYICNTVLKTDIREISIECMKIVCILSKNIKDSNYQEITYINKKYRNNNEIVDLINKIVK